MLFLSSALPLSKRDIPFTCGVTRSVCLCSPIAVRSPPSPRDGAGGWLVTTSPLSSPPPSPWRPLLGARVIQSDPPLEGAIVADADGSGHVGDRPSVMPISYVTDGKSRETDLSPSIASHCIALHRIASDRIALHCIALDRIALLCIASHCIAIKFDHASSRNHALST